MTSDRIKEIQEGTAYPESLSVKQALCKVRNYLMVGNALVYVTPFWGVI